MQVRWLCLFLSLLVPITLQAGQEKPNLRVRVGVAWQLCDLDLFHRLELAFDRDESAGWGLLASAFAEGLSGQDKLSVLMKNANYYAARAQLYASLQPREAVACDTFFWDGKQSYCQSLPQSTGPVEQVATFDFDHHYPDKSSRPHYVLYSKLTGSKLAPMIELAKHSGRPFVFRPITAHAGCRSPAPGTDREAWVDLSEAIITEFEAKNEEYAGKKDKKRVGKITLPPELAHVARRSKELAIDYSIPLPDVDNMALKITQAALESPVDALAALKTLVCNYPVLQATLNKLSPKKTFLASAEAQHKWHAPHQPVVRINGLDVNADAADWYRWLQLALEFDKFSSNNKVSPGELTELIVQQDEEAARTLYTLDTEGVVFLNDLEKDAMYAQWPRNLEALLQHQNLPPQFGSMKIVRRNIVTAVVIVPWGHAQFLDVLTEWSKTVQQHVPMRMGFLVVVGAARSANTQDDYAERLMHARVFHRLQIRQNVQDAFRFAVAVKNAKKTCDEALAEVVASSEPATCQDFAQDFALPLSAHLVERLSVWINGRLAASDTLGELVQRLTGLYHQELARCIEAVRDGRLTDDDDLQAFIFDRAHYRVLPYYLPRVDSVEGATPNVLYMPRLGSCPEGLKCAEWDLDSLAFNRIRVHMHPDIAVDRQAAMLVAYGRAWDEQSQDNGASMLERAALLSKLESFKAHLKQILYSTVVDGDGRPVRGRDDLRISLGKPSSGTLLHVQVVMNPVHRGFPRLLLQIMKLKAAGLLAGELFLNPPARIVDYPFRDFFSAEGTPPSLVPQHALLSVKADVPSSWIVVQDRVSVGIDVDNVRLQSMGRDGEIVFALRHLVLEGQFVHDARQTPGAGIQLTLEDRADERVIDETTVMANHGYFQLKAQPGVYDLSDRISGQRHLRNLAVGTLSVPLAMLKVPLPDDWHARILGQQARSADPADDTAIHVFSIASGLAYERLIRIMMASVARQRNKKDGRHLVFWLFDAYVSPQFRESVRKLQDELGFGVRFVSYKWPVWLAAQRTKLRTVWACKILFLDVIFPLHLKRIVFLDADQVARADIAALADVDMDDCVYGMVPFCEDRPEMAPYRFWRTPGSYWDGYLQGRPYHISALIVIDLQRLRATLTGDMLRGHYQMLVNDPHSLSNLDQDLPNSMQHRVPIFSLPAEWLWCGTWCSDKSKSNAKVIDLCNNPKTKQDKLQVARISIPEWSELDALVARIVDGGPNAKAEL